jgi:hypothetical protein
MIDELMSAGNASEKKKDLLIDSFISQSHHVEDLFMHIASVLWCLTMFTYTYPMIREGSTFGLYKAQYWHEVFAWYGDIKIHERVKSLQCNFLSSFFLFVGSDFTMYFWVLMCWQIG